MTPEEIKNLSNDILRLVRARGTGDGTQSMIASLISNCQTVSRAGERKVNSADTVIHTNSIVSGKTLAPVVTISWGEREGQMSPGEARDFAERVRRTADAAESDAFVFDFLTNNIGTDPDRAATVLHLFREFRESRTRKDYLPPEESRVKQE